LDFVFVGPTVNLTTIGTQRITAAGSFSVGSTVAGFISVDMCFRPSVSVAAPTSPGLQYKVVNLVANQRTMFSPTTSFQPGAGTWTIGNCVLAGSITTLNFNNDYSTGWAFVSN